MDLVMSPSSGDALLCFVKRTVTPRMMTRTTGVSEARCQLILTQLVLAGLAKDNGGYGNKFRRCQ
ncbi:TPA: hypothetical protein ACHF8O_003121 [Escherichia coli]